MNYINVLRMLNAQDISIVSSHNLASLCDVTASQLRKDLMDFPVSGKQKVGYDVSYLLDALRTSVQRQKTEPIIVVGAGFLGTALLKYPGFKAYGFDIIAAFDVDVTPRKDVAIPIIHVSEMPDFIRKNEVKLAILSVPGEAAQSIARKLAEAGIIKILNLAPVVLALPDTVNVNNVNIVFELEYLMFGKDGQS